MGTKDNSNGERSMKSFLENLNKYWATPAIAIMAGALGLYFNSVKQNLENQALEIKNAASKIESELREREFSNELKIQMYSEVKDAISKDDEKLQSAVLLMINEMLADDSLFREKLITILLASPTTSVSVKETQNEITDKSVIFQKEQKAIDNSKFTIDVFYLEDIIAESQPRAEKIQHLLEQKYPNYDVRLRLLPRLTNAKSGYRISANEIRFEESEKDIAEDLKSLIVNEGIFELEQPRLKLIYPKKQTPNYLSLFVRNM